MPSISYAFGLYEHDLLVGVLTIGKPASRSLCVGIMGEEYAPYIYELNRLIINEGLTANALSWFVSKCMKMLKDTDILIVSFADDGVGHKGYIYQATNFLYIGKTKERTDKYMPGNKHSRHYTDEYKHIRKFRTAKHRYIYIPNKRKRKEYLDKLKYPIMEYPKGDNERYVLGERVKTKIINTETNQVYYE